MSLVISTDGFDDIEYSESPSWRVSGGFDSGKLMYVVSVSSSSCSVGLWNSWIQRSLYRFILGSFLFCPVGTTSKNASQVFSVWVSYKEPWTIKLDDFSELAAIVNGSTKEVRKQKPHSQASGYLPLWKGYCLIIYTVVNWLCILLGLYTSSYRSRSNNLDGIEGLFLNCGCFRFGQLNFSVHIAELI